MAVSREPGRSTASRLFAVLGAFDKAEPVLTLTRIAELAGLPLATAHRVTGELTRAGALERNEDGTYQVGLRLWELGSLAPRQRDLRRVARPMMQNLHEATGATVQLAVLDGRRALVVEKLSGSRSAANITEVAGGLPLHATGVGKVILGFTAAEEGLLGDGEVLSRYTGRTVTDLAQLHRELVRVRQDYLGYSYEELTAGTASAASPVFDAQGRFVAALGILSDAPVRLRRLAPAVRTAALSISQRLGHRPTGRPLRVYG